MDNAQQPPKEAPPTVDAFRNSGWKAIVAGAVGQGYYGRHDALSRAARQALDAGTADVAKVLGLLADLCSMHLRPDNVSEPFGPMWAIEGRRSTIPDDIADHQILFLSNIAAELDDAYLRARVFDVLWLRRRPRKLDDALQAIDAYRGIPLGADLTPDAVDCWERAVVLCQYVRRPADSALAAIQAALVQSILQRATERNYYALKLAMLLRRRALLGGDAATLAAHLQTLGDTARHDSDFLRARDHYEESSACYAVAKDAPNEYSLLVEAAECCASEALAQTLRSPASYAAAASWTESAIQTFRRIPHAHRPSHGVEDRLAELQKLMPEYGAQALGEMNTFTSPPIDLTEMATAAMDSVRGKPPLEALVSFARYAVACNYDRDRTYIETSLHKNPLTGLFSGTHLALDGRVVAKVPSAPLNDSMSDEHQAIVAAQLLQHYERTLQLVVQGALVPALEVLLAEHRLRVHDFVELARHSPAVTPGRETLVGKALSFGWDGDYASALHLLTPQLEHMVRTHLKAAGELTSVVNPDGIEREKGLSTLLESQQADALFGKNLAFEIRSLFCGPIGPNLRNDVAHGLIDDRSSQSIFAFYAWAFFLRLVVLPLWRLQRSQHPTAAPEPGSPSTAEVTPGPQGAPASQPLEGAPSQPAP